jgi:hypothetical protein
MPFGNEHKAKDFPPDVKRREVPVYVPILESISEGLKNATASFTFWVVRWQFEIMRSGLAAVIISPGKLAGIRFHAHQLRDSFAIDSLLKGVPLATLRFSWVTRSR